MNIVRYDGTEFFDYAHYWVENDINIFIGGRMTGKTYSFGERAVPFVEYEYTSGLFTRRFGKRVYEFSTRMLPYRRGDVLSFIRIKDFQEWHSDVLDRILELQDLTEIKSFGRYDNGD